MLKIPKKVTNMLRHLMVRQPYPFERFRNYVQKVEKLNKVECTPPIPHHPMVEKYLISKDTHISGKSPTDCSCQYFFQEKWYFI